MGTYRALWAADRTDSFAGTGVRDAPNSSPYGDTIYGSAALTYSF
jgi:hypothetical protein